MSKPLRYVNAIAQALSDAMTDDPSVMLFGEDVAAAGGPFKATRGLLDTHGPDRVRDTPISEASIVGAAVGAALTGMKPVVEIMFMDFVALAMDAVVNQAAKARFMFGGQCSVPMVLRTPHGGGLNAGPQHSQCLEAWFAHIPGLRVVCPATVADAYSLLRASIEAPDPVVFVENKALYALQGDIDVNAPREIGKARIDRPGRHVTIVTYGATLYAARAAADRLAQDGVEAEIIDLRWIQPWDEETVFASVAKTHRVVIAHEAVQAFGVGAEIAARIASDLFDELDAPVLRVGAPFMPIPFAKSLETAYLPDADRIVAAVKDTLA
ncbi:alpha-ketoacid dehydrogenase subunit beta [Azospirillum palustre]|uniref:Alpha-ketoacid dehydrogenase subunit beta n=1 Tax=Azospirillum palustre TaxID=2044885 RepID=A0A2B8BHK8_9PROT|nr:MULTISPECIES: alpha-ketoacid dehydrogenase subunit beta [Azospirillum]MDR6775420.1 pyruvate dehydrogenase E1 component beta subunit [Azospirillum sp. BE72]PGH57240.1 alpha-ketoacid dehydrogenase subunit beta [Azospirillum palustre]PWC94101.1 pyruvate dehydrogenase [Azospirillum sp. TSO5]